MSKLDNLFACFDDEDTERPTEPPPSLEFPTADKENDPKSYVRNLTT